MKQTELEQRLIVLLTPVIEHRGYRLVSLRMHGPTLEILAEDPATRRLGVDDCAVLSRELSAVLDVEDIIGGAYKLEVGSPGIDRPLVNMEDFVDFAGFEAKIELDTPMPTGQKRFRGRLCGAKNNEILLDTEDQGSVALPFRNIQKAKLLLTDELIKHTKTKTEVKENGTSASC
ncbi:MAG: ribosome maturation factor RimP [Proteobacteria bacterium]|nr:ribosome maturation factor RimP [Pseudomonadota bacterium]